MIFVEKPIAAALSAVILAACATVAHAETRDAHLSEIANGGGLLEVRQGDATRWIRLYGVAGLEKGQPYETEATTHILESAMDQTLRIDVVAQDGQGIPVAWVRLPDGSTLNGDLLRNGLAWWDALNAPDERELKSLAAQALAEKSGLWADPVALAPWDYRARLGLGPIRYKTPKTAAKPAVKRPESPAPTLKAKGDPAPPRKTKSPPVPPDYMDLVAKHQPRIERDATGSPLGLTASNIAAIPGAKDLGFRNGDIVQSVNGIRITSELQLLGLVSQLDGAKVLKLNVLRDGKPMKMDIPLN